MVPISVGSVELIPKPTPGVISEITMAPCKGPEDPFRNTVHVAVILSEVTSMRVVPLSSMLPVKITDIFYSSRRIFMRSLYSINHLANKKGDILDVGTNLQYVY